MAYIAKMVGLKTGSTLFLVALLMRLLIGILQNTSELTSLVQSKYDIQINVIDKSGAYLHAQQHYDPGADSGGAENDLGDGPGSAFCLIMKDDNDLLAEWIAYHYHVFNMRRLFVAIDPTSKTTPDAILEPFQKNFGLDITIWNDPDYTPTWWREHQPLEHQASLNMVNTKKYRNCNPVKLYDDDPFYEEPDQGDDFVERCNHIFRQRMFYSECMKEVKREREELGEKDDSAVGIKWTVFTDTDEFLVPNPWVGQYIHNKRDKSLLGYFLNHTVNFRRNGLKAIFPDGPTPGSLFQYFLRFNQGINHTNSSKCSMIPRINFGAVEDGDDHSTTGILSDKKTTTIWSHNNFETLRWKYHRTHEYLDWPKGMLNIAHITEQEASLYTRKEDNYTIYDFKVMKPHMHYPYTTCDWVDKKKAQVYALKNGNPHWYKQPLAHHHYTGSIERFLGRVDARRDTSSYNKKNTTSNYARGDENIPLEESINNERWWIKGWLDSFVATHGAEKVYTVLGNYGTRTQSKAA